MNSAELIKQIEQKRSFLCVGLDTDITLIPSRFKAEKDPIFAFNKAVIDATLPYTVAYKPNIAFYEALGPAGWESLQKTMEYMPKDVFSIADAKRGDIGNTATKYAQTFFEPARAGFDFDSVTVAPYMGEDSVTPFLQFENKWVILLALTSNPGSNDFQQMKDENGIPFYENVMRKSMEWGNTDQLMFVIGATRTDYIAKVREIAPDNFFLVPGVGAQGGSLSDVAKFGMNSRVGLLVNSSRGIIYAGDDTSLSAAREAKKVQEEMNQLLDQYYK
ncbi:orotidine-5'-phosphate decarboxylase [Aquirufa antheringensis]|uniref:orotidine-5'-phosphate decarboxylase n=1 Tax=Aquirufa antheringensis TaxID=2516559 RepID=UPI00208F3A71|nr:orotidine-5'-phosphate decarboxylase [Aquirufa antheringensis]USQ04707.1 orotidine-5'-phosphate decarboxylase [Aquirufa antheringensis]